MGELVESTTATAGFDESIGCGVLAINGGGLCVRILKHEKGKRKTKKEGGGMEKFR